MRWSPNHAFIYVCRDTNPTEENAPRAWSQGAGNSVPLKVLDLKGIADRLKPVKGKDEIDTTPHDFSITRVISRKKSSAEMPEYNFSGHGPLVDTELPPGYREVERYWVDEGRSLVDIALNENTNQYEYPSTSRASLSSNTNSSSGSMRTCVLPSSSQMKNSAKTGRRC